MRASGVRAPADSVTERVQPYTGRDGRGTGSRTDLVDALLCAPHLEGNIVNLLAAGDCGGGRLRAGS